MKIEPREITVRELSDGFEDKAESGVVGYGGKLDIRPPCQREFIYKDKQRDAVIDTVSKSFPLNVMYWAVREDGHFEVIDGQQRTLSICQYVNERSLLRSPPHRFIAAPEITMMISIIHLNVKDSRLLAQVLICRVTGHLCHPSVNLNQ